MAQKITRAQLARIVNNDEQAIRFFEALIRQVSESTPISLDELRVAIDAAELEAGYASASASSAHAELARIADALEMIPAVFNPVQEDFLPAPMVETKDHYYGAFHDSGTQACAATGTPEAITFDSTDISFGVYVGSPTSRIYVNGHGVYNFQFSAQLDNTSGGVSLVYVWARVNGVDIPESAGKIRIKDNNSEQVAAWNYVLHMGPGDYFELMWETSDTSTVMLAEASTATHPAVPSVILTVTNNID